VGYVIRVVQPYRKQRRAELGWAGVNPSACQGHAATRQLGKVDGHGCGENGEGREGNRRFIARAPLRWTASPGSRLILGAPCQVGAPAASRSAGIGGGRLRGEQDPSKHGPARNRRRPIASLAPDGSLRRAVRRNSLGTARIGRNGCARGYRLGHSTFSATRRKRSGSNDGGSIPAAPTINP